MSKYLLTNIIKFKLIGHTENVQSILFVFREQTTNDVLFNVVIQ